MLVGFLIDGKHSGIDKYLLGFAKVAKENGVIRKQNGMYIYGEDGNLILGASEEAVIDWMRQPKNKKTMELIRKDAYPDMVGIE